MHSETKSWTDKDFLAFLMIYASKADTRTTEEEILWIRKKCQISGFENLIALFNTQSEFQNIQTIQSERERFFPGEEGKGKIQEFLTEFFHSDGQFTLLEQNVMRVLSRII